MTAQPPESITPEESRAWMKVADARPTGRTRHARSTYVSPDGWTIVKEYSSGSGQGGRAFTRVTTKARSYYAIFRPDGTKIFVTASTLEAAKITVARRKFFDANPS